MKTIKIIDLLNKIANGEEVPKIIIGKNSMGKKEIYAYNDFWYIHIFENPDGEEDYYYMNRDIKDLNDEVEIIEDGNKIEKIERLEYSTNFNKEEFMLYKNILSVNGNVNDLIDTVNELLDYLESKEKGE